MNERDNHIKYRQIKFSCLFMKPILSDEEYEILCEYGTWMEALHLKKIKPLNSRQAIFLQNIESDTPPQEEYANIFWKYLKRNEISKKCNLNNVMTKISDDREDWKKIRKMRF